MLEHITPIHSAESDETVGHSDCEVENTVKGESLHAPLVEALDALTLSSKV